MKTIAAIAIALMLASRTEAAPEPASSKCMSYPPFCPYGQAPLCVCESDYSYSCIWMCASTR
jgi:hypothetical protein